MKYRTPVAVGCALAVFAAPASAMADSFSGTVKGNGIKARYSIENKGSDKVCVDYRGSKTNNEPESVTFSAKGESYKVRNQKATSDSCSGDKSFARALKRANKVDAKGKGPYGERISGTLR